MLIAAVVLVLAFVLIGTAWLRLHAFLVLLVGACVLALASGLPVADGLKALIEGFGKTAGTIGIVIACGAIIGVALEESGGAEAIARGTLRTFGSKRALLAIGLTGAVVSIPVFCDSGFILLAPIAFRVASHAGASKGAAAVMLSMGLYFTHVLAPPTPGPVAAAAALGVDVSMMVGAGVAIAVIGVIALRMVAERISAWAARAPDATLANDEQAGEVADAVGRIGAGTALVPILLPVVLMGAKSFFTSSDAAADTPLSVALVFMGEPSISLLIGAFVACALCAGGDRATWTRWADKALAGAGPIVLITAAGGALGGVLRATTLPSDLSQALAGVNLGAFALLVPFVTAAFIKTLLGSSTVSMATTAPVVASMLGALRLADGAGPLLAALSVAAGSMIVSHPNDSYFWVVREFSGFGVSQTLRLQTTASLLCGVVTFALVLGASFVLGV